MVTSFLLLSPAVKAVVYFHHLSRSPPVTAAKGNGACLQILHDKPSPWRRSRRYLPPGACRLVRAAEGGCETELPRLCSSHRKLSGVLAIRDALRSERRRALHLMVHRCRPTSGMGGSKGCFISLCPVLSQILFVLLSLGFCQMLVSELPVFSGSGKEEDRLQSFSVALRFL